MEPEERRRANALDSYWDAFLRNPTLARPPGVDAVAEAVIMHLNHGPALPPRAAQERLRQQITAQARAGQTLAPPVPASLPLNRQTPPRMGQFAVQFATMLLVVVSLGFAYATLRSVPAPREPGYNLPAVMASGTPATHPAGQETLVSFTLPADAIPTSSNLDAIAWSAALDPGAATDAMPGCCRGSQIVHVLDGELTLRVDGPLQIIRANHTDAAADAVAAETTVTLNPGDSAIFDYALAASYANRASAPLHLVGGGLLAGWFRGAPAGLTLIDYNQEYPISTIPAGPVDLALLSATLPPGDAFPAPPPGVIVIDVGGLADADIGKGSDGALRNLGPAEATFYVLSVAPGGTAQGGATPAPTP